ncbi:hypothetical protein ILUMI_24396 [Ignelater luminosus]|uniref:Uncharacterized protein n=1 Tax=Ignelater luminosus TaxID=2038154 RepID=A0A8K0CAA7_IGNLU|nr:hypothetical protein ILUMI_24396 [Ignelater luminosus]
MHRLYLKSMQQENKQQVATQRQYREILNSEFNIGFFKPKKDQCEICTAYKQGSETIKHKMKQKYDSHINNKEAVRSLKDLDKDFAMNDKTDIDFYSFADIVKSQNWVKDEEGDKMKISKVKEVSFCKTSVHQKMNFRYDFSSSPRSINLKKSSRTITEDLPKLHQQLLPIESKKLKGLLELCHNNDIPEIYHNFYFSLKSKKSIGATNFEAEENTTDSDENSSDCE